MSAKKRPAAVMLLACLYAAVGAIGFILNLHAYGQPDFYPIELTELAALVAGVFMFLGKNWARWLALLWMAFHVALSATSNEPWRSLPVHSVIFALIVLILFRAESREYFRAG